MIFNKPLQLLHSTSGAARKYLGTLRMLWFPHHFEPDVCSAIERNVKPGWTCADVGANIGSLTMLLAKIVGPSGKVIAFEAYHRNARFLRQLAKLYGYAKRITVENKAVSDGSQAEVILYPGRRSSSEEWNIMGHDVEGHKMQAALRLPSTSLDSYFPSGTVLNFVKIDIEGAEALALRGMRRILHEQRPLVLVEFHNDEAWESGVKELIGSAYVLYSIKGQTMKSIDQSRRLYHCLACPSEIIPA
jgi:FkbM family methyltransferase